MNKQSIDRAIAISSQAINDIDELAKREEFQAFMAGLRERADELADEILHEEMTTEEREIKRQRRLELLGVLRKPSDDRKSHVAALRNLGVTVD